MPGLVPFDNGMVVGLEHDETQNATSDEGLRKAIKQKQRTPDGQEFGQNDKIPNQSQIRSHAV